MDYLCECSTDRDRRAALQKLPPDLPSSYERILERVNRSTKENQTLVKNTLHWIVYAQAQLSTKQLLQALAVRDDDTYFDESATTSEEEILHWCSSLVRKTPFEPILELAHFTVKEFLLAIDPMGNPRFLRYRLSGDHSVLAKSCINFLKCENLFDLSPLELEFQEASRQEHSKGDCGGNDGANIERWVAFWDTWASFTNEYDFIGYASINWNYHVHHSDWEAVQKIVLDFFIPSFNKISLWTFASVCFPDRDVPHELNEYNLLKEPGRPQALYWAAGFALDKVCKILIQKGAEVNQASRFGTPMYCSLAWAATSKFTPVLDLESLWSSETPPPVQTYVEDRNSTIRLLLNAGADIHTQIATDNRNKYLELALTADKYEPFGTLILLDAGVKLSTTSFRILLSQLSDMILFDIGWTDDASSKAILWFMERVLVGGDAGLEQDAYDSFLAYTLDVICCGCLISAELLSCFENSSSFRKMLPPGADIEFNDLLNKGKGSGNPNTDLVRFLSKAIRITSRFPQDALLHLQNSLSRATTAFQPWAVIALLDLNPDLDSSLDADGNPLLNIIVDGNYGNYYDNKRKSIIEALISHGANVLQKNKSYTRSAIEMAAYYCDAAIFRLFWDSAESTEPPDFMCMLGKTLVWRAISTENYEVQDFLEQKLGRKFTISRTNSFAWSSDQGTSLDHARKLLLFDSTFSGSNVALEGTGDWRLDKEEDPDSPPEARAVIQEPDSFPNPMILNLPVRKPAPLTSIEPTIFELNRINSTKPANIYAQAQSNPTPSRSEEDFMSEFNQAGSQLAPVPRYLVWQHPTLETLEIDENPPTTFLLLDEDSKPVLEGILRRACDRDLVARNLAKRSSSFRGRSLIPAAT
jgi:hypothetical protein